MGVVYLNQNCLQKDLKFNTREVIWASCDMDSLDSWHCCHESDFHVSGIPIKFKPNQDSGQSYL